MKRIRTEKIPPEFWVDLIKQSPKWRAYFTHLQIAEYTKSKGYPPPTKLMDELTQPTRSDIKFTNLVAFTIQEQLDTVGTAHESSELVLARLAKALALKFAQFDSTFDFDQFGINCGLKLPKVSKRKTK